MALPIIAKSKSWVSEHLKYRVADIDDYTDAKGMVRIALVDNVLAAVLTDLNAIKLALGLQRFDVGIDGQRLYDGLKALTIGNLRGNTLEFETLCQDLSKVSRHDFEALKEFWGLDTSPEAVMQSLQWKVENHKRRNAASTLSPVVFAAVENLRAVAASPRYSISTSL